MAFLSALVALSPAHYYVGEHFEPGKHNCPFRKRRELNNTSREARRRKQHAFHDLQKHAEAQSSSPNNLRILNEILAKKPPTRSGRSR
jgi:hypothetical protein